MKYILMNKNTPILSCTLKTDGGIDRIEEIFHSEYLPVGIPIKKDSRIWHLCAVGGKIDLFRPVVWG